ncbi:unnamed protein product [Allacma fusca]|uniref:Reelin domain-containing protein n=1 Tax=Allacma fusca TaxID=39272 RepID=A0A8J2KR96_9HEXA|nr:unnamed protein product [Allacma fusca]
MVLFPSLIPCLVLTLQIAPCSSKLSKLEIDEQFHSPEGCIPYKELPKFYNHNIRRPDIQTPNWCKQLVPTNLTSKPETSKAFEISTLQFKLSSYINATVRPIGNNQPLKEVYMVARSIDIVTKEFSRIVGRFVPTDNTHLVCCNYIDRNAIIIFPEGSPTATVRWWPDGDFMGLFVFQATVINEQGQFWTNVQSNVTIAFY